MNRIELTTKRDALRRQLDALAPIAMTCRTCTYLSSHGICELFDDRPPAEAMSTDIGCESWEYDGIPF
jgi:hypothetical protein